MKKTYLFLLVSLFLFSTFVNAQRSSKLTMSIKAGSYLFNTTDLYFFDDGIDCYLLKKCHDIDSVFSQKANTITLNKDNTVRYQAYLYTDNYEYAYVKINKEEGWIRIKTPVKQSQRNYFKTMLKSDNFDMKSSYVEVMPFKNPSKIFISTTDDWFIGDIDKLSSKNIGTKRGRLEACQMVYSKNCVKCYVDLGWGREIWYDDKGKKIKIK